MADSLDSLFARMEASRGDRPLPPVDAWQPERTGDSHLKIDRNCQWYYRGSPITRPAMVRLFSTILRRDDDGFVLVTPVEKLTIDVEDAPFLATAVEQRGSGQSAQLAFLTNVDEIIIADAQHPIAVHETSAGPKPYLRVRGRLDALISRPVYYELVAMGEEHEPHRLSVVSAGTRFTLGEF